jgi:ACS family glucarate transporter-like MFS transporter
VDLKTAPRISRPRIRWRIFALLFALGLVAYVQQKSLTIAAERMMPELRLTQLEIGWLEQAFVLGYTIFQLPGGLLGQRLGARRALTLYGLVAFGAVLATPLLPEYLAGHTLFIMLLATQLLLGASQAGLFPVSAGVFATWFPSRQWPLVEGLGTMGLGLGAAITAPLIATLSAMYGWQRALLWSSAPGLVLSLAWLYYARNVPREHRAVSREELAELGEVAGATLNERIGWRRLGAVLSNGSVRRLALSYLAMNYSFYLLSNWCFLYLVQERHFSALASGWLAVAPPLASAVGAGLGGALTVRLCERFGLVRGLRLVPLWALLGAGMLLPIATRLGDAYAALCVLTLCFGLIELTEGAFWGATIRLGGANPMVAGGIVNTCGNLGGIIGIPIVAYLSGQHRWDVAFLIGGVSAVVSALLWLAISPSVSTQSHDQAM